jgi:hypothetical protein
MVMIFWLNEINITNEIVFIEKKLYFNKYKGIVEYI